MKKTQILVIAMILAITVTSILFWKSLIIWATPVFPITLSIYVCRGGKFRLWVYRKKVVANPFLYISIAISLISTLAQFGSQILNSVTRFANSSEAIWIFGVLAVILVVILIYYGVQDYKEKTQLKKSRKLTEKKDADLKKQSDEKKKAAKELLGKIQGQEKVTWTDIQTLYFDGKITIPSSLIVKANFMELVEISNIKKQLNFIPNHVEFAADRFDSILKGCNDELIQKVIDQLKCLEEYKGYGGYTALVKTLNNSRPLIRSLVNLQVSEVA